jgi:pyruvate dehydrogenase E1 component alpha subunit
LADPDELRSSDEKQFWGGRDPIEKLGDYLVEHNLANQEELKAIKVKIQGVVDDAVKFAEDSPEPDASELYRYVFAEDE